jgi:OOP family OmpA-OmpF porin
MRRGGIGLLGAVLAFLSLGLSIAGQSSDAAAMVDEVVRTGSVIVRGIRFAQGQAAPAAGSERSLSALRAMLTKHTEWSFEVQVHTNETGDPDQDLSISQARADSVAAWLRERGIAPARLVAKGCGSATPLRAAPASDPALQHRRVELRKLNEE